MRVFLVVIDSFGIGGAVDAFEYNDEGSNTYENIVKETGVSLNNLVKLGINNIDGVGVYPIVEKPKGKYARLQALSKGKDTTTGHWELAGLVVDKPFPTFPNGFPAKIIESFEKAIGTKTLFNGVASGTEIINRLGREHKETGYPIVYTSADSVFQLACDETIMPLKRIYEMCEIARKLLVGENGVGRVIARPFIEKDGEFVRTENRKDFSIIPFKKTMLDKIVESGKKVIAVGKISDIFAGQGITDSIHTSNNKDGLNILTSIMEDDFDGLCFINLVDTDMKYGHRNDVDGYAKALIEIDETLPTLLGLLKEDDVFIITADHGCDPTTTSTDHSRENVPLLVYGKRIQPENLGTIKGFGYVSEFVLRSLNIKL